MKHKSIKKRLTVTKNKSKKNKTQKRFRKNHSGGGEDDYPSKGSSEFNDYLEEYHPDVYKELDYLYDSLYAMPKLTRYSSPSEKRTKFDLDDDIARVKAEKEQIYEKEYKKYIDNLKAKEERNAKAKKDEKNSIKYKKPIGTKFYNI